MSTRSYSVISALVFTVVALGHVLRGLAGWPLIIGGWSAPLAVSWLAAGIAASLAIWGYRQGGLAAR